MMKRQRWSWVVLNQSPTPAFLEMIDRLATDLGPCLCLIGKQLSVERDSAVTVEVGPRYDRRSRRSRARSWAAFSLFAARRVLALQGRPFLFAVTNPPTMPYLSWLANRVHGLRFGILVWDIYPDHMVQMGWLRRDGTLRAAWDRLNGETLERSSLVVTIGETMRSALREKLKRRARSIEVIPNWVDTKVFKPSDKRESALAQRLGQREKFTVLYSGNFGGSHELASLPRAAELLSGNPRVHFLLVGEGFSKNSIEAEVRQRGLDNVTLLPRQPWEDLPELLACADAAIVAQKQGTERLSVPSKTYYLLAAGVPILAISPAGGEVAQLVEREGVGRQVEPGDAQGLTAAVTALEANEPHRREMARRARQIAERDYDKDVVFGQLHRALRAAMQGGVS